MTDICDLFCRLRLSQLCDAGSVNYVIDTLKLHDDMAVLRPIFADPSIVKVSAETL